MTGRLSRFAAGLRALAAALTHRDPRDLLAVSAEALRRYRLRTGLSVLGVVLGVAAVIAILSVSEGARRESLQQVELLGLDNLVVRARPASAGEPAAVPLTVADAERARLLLPLVSFVSPLVERYGEVSGLHGSRPARLLGVTDEYFSILRLQVLTGRPLVARDVPARAQVCVLGAALSRALFGYRSAVGAAVRFQGEWHHVVGVLADRTTDTKGTSTLAARDLNHAVLLPISSLLARLPTLDPEQAVDELWIGLREGERVVEVGRIAETTLHRDRRGPVAADVVVPRELLQQRYRTQRTFGIVVGSVAVLSLLIGGIGIMNIMLASVLERTHEIGIRRTVGATRRDITLQFLLEALLMTLGGGATGVFCGVGVSWAITAYAGWSTHLSITAVGLALAVSVAVGLGFGIYPAVRAARLDPIDALRYE